MGGTGGAEPLEREAPGGRLTVVIREVEETRVGSEMSALLIDFLRLVGMLPWFWKPLFVGVVVVEISDVDSMMDELECAEYGVTGDGRGDVPVSGLRLVWRGASFCTSKYPGLALLSLLALSMPTFGTEGWVSKLGGAGGRAGRRAGGIES
jgi:hypothetical protein